jgi:hypothetical protein
MALAVACPVMAQDAGAPSATDLYFADVERFCVATGGDWDLALAAAEAAGWTPAPAAVVAALVNPDAPQIAMRLSPTTGPDQPQAQLMLSVSPPMEDADGVVVRACAVVAEPDARIDVSSLVELATARIGVEPGRAPQPVWVYSGTGPYVSELDLVMSGGNAMFEAAAQRPIFMLTVTRGAPGQANLALLRAGR